MFTVFVAEYGQLRAELARAEHELSFTHSAVGGKRRRWIFAIMVMGIAAAAGTYLDIA